MEIGRDGGEDGNQEALLVKDEQGEDGGSHIWVVVISTLVAVSGSYVFGSAVGYSSPAELGIMNDLGLTLAQYSLFGSILTIGAMIGAIMSGKIADFIGRRGAMGISDIFCLAGWLAIFFSKAAWLLDLGRLSVGYGIGLLSYVVPVYIAEITPKNLRGGFTTVNQLRNADDMLWSILYLSLGNNSEVAYPGTDWDFSMLGAASRPLLHSRISKMAGKDG